jgi:DNA-binding transcriptional LysR family regulator
MDVRQLRHFATVAETLHFGKAAQRLHMTQPPLSQSILALEREIGAPLFVRTKRHVSLTAFGEQWLERVRPVLRALDELPETAQRLREGRTGRLTLSFVSTADYNLLPSLVRQFAAALPDVELRLIEATSDVQISALLDRQVHASILIPPAGALPPELDYLQLLEEPLIAAVPDEWIEEKRLDPAPGRVIGTGEEPLPLILFPKTSSPGFHDLVTGYFADRGRSFHIVQQAIQMQTIISLVSAGLGMALVPASLRNLGRAGVRYLDLEGAPRLETGLVWRRGDDTPALLRFIGFVREMTDLSQFVGDGVS